VPVGMVTMGSPVALFMLRKPELLNQLGNWRYLCPQAFLRPHSPQDLRWPQAGMVWRWLNFLHPADLVAHRLEPYYNTSQLAAGPDCPPLRFVEDVDVWEQYHCPATDPVSAHSCYWHLPQLKQRIGALLAERLLALHHAHDAGKGSYIPPSPL
jgi:hypothetical protein